MPNHGIRHQQYAPLDVQDVQELERAHQAESGPVQELTYHEETLPKVQVTADSEECRQGHQDPDTMDLKELAQVEREDSEHPLPIL